MKLHEFVEWSRNDLVYKAPEQWPGVVARFMDELVERYENVDEKVEDAA